MRFLMLSALAIVHVAELKPDCCDKGLSAASSYYALFEPALDSCPPTAFFICFTPNYDTSPTKIVINGATTVATGADGMLSFAELVCRQSDQKWTTKDGQIVKKISCQ